MMQRPVPGFTRADSPKSSDSRVIGSSDRDYNSTYDERFVP